MILEAEQPLVEAAVERVEVVPLVTESCACRAVVSVRAPSQPSPWPEIHEGAVHAPQRCEAALDFCITCRVTLDGAYGRRGNHCAAHGASGRVDNTGTLDELAHDDEAAAAQRLMGVGP